MATMKMLMMLMLATILFCSYQQVIVAREVVVEGMNNDIIPCWPIEWPWCSSPSPPPLPSSCTASDQEKVNKCMFKTTSIDECCPIFKNTLGTKCPCYKYAEDLDNQVLITLESYCDIDSPCKSMQAPHVQQSRCSISDQEKLKDKCMLSSGSIDECCPIFKSIVKTNCPCYNYAKDLDYELFITLYLYCDVDSSCPDDDDVRASN